MSLLHEELQKLSIFGIAIPWDNFSFLISPDWFFKNCWFVGRLPCHGSVLSVDNWLLFFRSLFLFMRSGCYRQKSWILYCRCQHCLPWLLFASHPLLLNLFWSISWNHNHPILTRAVSVMVLMVLDCCCCWLLSSLANVCRNKRAVSQNSDIKKAEKGQKKGRKKAEKIKRDCVEKVPDST